MNRLSKVLARAGIASRRKCEELILNGEVCVNGLPVFIPQTKVSLERDHILVNGQPVKQEQDKVYFMLNKPRGYICSNQEIGTKKLVIHLFKKLPYRLFTAGRLDRETTGLILVTNDGLFAQSAIHPSRGFTKEYLIKVSQEITHEHLKTLSEGCFVEGTWIKPVSVSKVRRGSFKVVIREGKKRELRTLVSQNTTLDIISLHRIRIGPLVLGNLRPGAYRSLTVKEQQLFLS